tara:strand:- start:109 stop:294 length:186 start_codon:yes stop_codon:yes gene_type:complete
MTNDPKQLINLTEKQSYGMVKLYDILTDINFELSEHQHAAFMQILDTHIKVYSIKQILNGS